jgi:hypothetical protein
VKGIYWNKSKKKMEGANYDKWSEINISGAFKKEEMLGQRI